MSTGSFPRWLQLQELGSSETRSFIWVSYIGTGTQTPEPSLTVFPGALAGSRMQIVQPGHKLMPKQDASIAVGASTPCVTELVPKTLKLDRS